MKKLFWLFIVLTMFTACKTEEEGKLRTDDKSIIQELASPFTLYADTSLLYLADYVLEPENEIDSVSMNTNFGFKLSVDKKKLKIWTKSTIPPLSTLKIWHKKTPYSILIKKNSKEKVHLSFSANKNIKKVQIKGEMNGWNPDSLEFHKKGNTWENTMNLSPGKYAYLLIVDGKEIRDPNSKETVPNGSGDYNSVLSVGNTNPQVPHLQTTTHKWKEIFIKAEGKIDSIIVFWQNYQLSSKYYSLKNGLIHIIAPLQVNDYTRTYYRVWAYNSDGVSNDLLIPLNDGHLLQDAKKITRQEKYGNIIYNVMIDRFVDGDTSNTKRLNTPEVLPKVDYFGGDLAGITKEIKENYFKRLNINSLWISPVIQNPWDAWGQIEHPKTKFSGYHGYWPISSTKIDKRFGTTLSFKELISFAHAEDMNVFLDYVANHIHKEHPLYKEHPDWTTSMTLPDGTLNLQKWDSHRLTTWFDTFLPTLDFSKPQVVSAMTDSALYWIQNYNIDGFRHDATKHIQHAFWRTLTYKIKKTIATQKDRSIYQIGETYGSPELIGSYVNSGELDGQFDFNVYDAAVAALAIPNVDFSNLKYKIDESLKTYGAHNLMGYITGNQDRPRFISLADGSVKFNEDTKLAGWTRDIEVRDTTAYLKLSQLAALMATLPGIPVIFYGDEFGMPGANDPDCRRMMRFGKQLNSYEQATLDRAKKIYYIRRHQLPLIYGDTKILMADSSNFVLLRQYFDQIVILVINKAKENKTLEIKIPKDFSNYPLKSNFGNSVKIEGNKLKITINGNYFDILTK